jgi:hypothetical protein
MWNVDRNCKVKLGGNYYINVERLVDYKGSSLFTVRRRDSDGLLGIDFDVYDAKGQKAATVRHGNVVAGDAQNYDISHDPHHYTVKEKSSGRTICDIRRQDAAEDADIEVAVDLFTPEGFHFQASPDKTNIGGIQMSGNIIDTCQVGIKIA